MYFRRLLEGIALVCLKSRKLRQELSTSISELTPYKKHEAQKSENIKSFNSLSRQGLDYAAVERRVLLYETSEHEKLYMQYPGKESARKGNRNLLDARPVLINSDGMVVPDMDFRQIWDILDKLARDHKADLDVLATLFVRVAYMIDYEHVADNFTFERVDISSGRVLDTVSEAFSWNRLSLDDDVIESLNDRFSLDFQNISFEAFLLYNDLLCQNEDCKYSSRKGARWDLKSGRVNTCLTYLTIIAYLKGVYPFSQLISNLSRSGVAPLPQKKIPEICDGLVRVEKKKVFNVQGSLFD